MLLSLITDELDDDLGVALDGCDRLGLGAVELRTLGGRSWLDLDEEDVADSLRTARGRGFAVVALATPVLKCDLPGAPAPAGALHGARATATLEDSWAQLDRALPFAARHRVPFLRIFSGWRVADPANVFELVVAAVAEAQGRAEPFPVEVLLENEHDCNVATARETEALLKQIPGLRVLWDPANHVRAGGDPTEAALDGSAGRIAHVHLKDVDARGTWVPLGTGRVPYADVVRRIMAAGFTGAFSLETHCEIDGSVERASQVALERLRAVVPSSA